MNTILKVGAAGALALGAVAAHATIAAPSSGSSDAILFAEVVNAAGTAAVASYAGDTGVSINSVITGLSTTGTKYLGSDANLAKLFAADAAGDTIQWAVLGGQYSGTATSGNFKTAGVAQFLTTTTLDSTSSLKNDTTGTLVKFGQINTDIGAINSAGIVGNSIEGASPATSGQWDVTGGSLNLAFWDGGATSNSNLLGGTQKLFYVTAGTPVGLTTKVAYTLEGTASLSANGLTLTGAGGSGPPPVPLPAAVWLLGSGLLGLTGVARRKLKV
jgi:hypothetical protein